MKIIHIRKIPKRPYASCDHCLYEGKRVLAPYEIQFVPTRGVTHWLCEKHYQQLRDEMAELSLIGAPLVGGQGENE